MTLQEARIHEGLQVQELANAANVSRTTIYNIENGTEVSEVIANRVVKALNRLAGTRYTVNELNIATS